MSGRIRSIKPEVLDDERAANLSDAAWRLWVSSWVLADDHGRFRANGKYLAAMVWQSTGCQRKAEKSLSELALKKFLRLYRVQDQLYAEIKPHAWRAHQRIDHPGKPRVPAPNESDYLDADSRKPSDDDPRVSDGLGTLSEGFRESRPSRTRARPPTSDLRPPTAAAARAREVPPGPTEPADLAKANGTVPHPDPPDPDDPEHDGALDAIRAELERWPSCGALPIPDVAAMLERRFRTNQIQNGMRIEWVVRAIGEAASDGVGLGIEALTKKLRSYCDRARVPRVVNAVAANGHDDEFDELTEEQIAKRKQDAEARRLAAITGPPPTPEQLADIKVQLARTRKAT
jgi:hypothetical protein